MSTATFRGTYTANGGEDYAAGTVSITPYGGSTVTATLDGSGHYSISTTLVLTSSTGLWLNTAGSVVTSQPSSGSLLIPAGGTVRWTKCRVVETISGVPTRSYLVEVQAGDVIETGRDVGTVVGSSAAIPPGTYVDTTTDQTKAARLGVTAIRSRDEPWSNALHPDFAVPQGGVANATTALAAMESQLTQGSTLYLPRGTYKAKLSPSIGHVTWKGDGMYATVVVPTASSISYMIEWAAIAPGVAFEDIGFDMSAATAGHVAVIYGYFTESVVFRRCRFFNVPGRFGLLTGLNGFTLEDCLHHSAGNARGQGWLMDGTTRKVRVQGTNKFLYVHDGIAGQDHCEDVTVDGAHFDLGFYLGKSVVQGSGGSVSYTATSITHTGADFASQGVIVEFDQIRVLKVKSTGTGAGVSFSLSSRVVDTGAAFVTTQVAEGDIVRAAGVWAVVQNVVSQTELVVEAWVNNSDYLPSPIPAAGTTYTVYGVQAVAAVGSVDDDTINVARWSDLYGIVSTPATGTLYEMYHRVNYPLHIDGEYGGGAARRVKVANSTFLRGRSDQISLFGVEAEITNNDVERGEDYGMTLDNSPATVMGNRVKNQGAVGIWLDGDGSAAIGNRVTGGPWANPADHYIGGILVTADHAQVDSNTVDGRGQAISRYGIVAYGSVGRSLANTSIGRNACTGHSVSDLRIGTDGDPTSLADPKLDGWLGTVSTDGTVGAIEPPLRRQTTPDGFTGKLINYEKADGSDAFSVTAGGLVTADSLRVEGGSLAFFGGASATQAADLPNTSGATLGDLEDEVNAIKTEVLRRYSLIAAPVPFDPTSITGLAQWLKADGLSLSDNDPVPSWTDLSGSGHHSIQATSGARPTYKGSIVNGLPVVRYDGVDDTTKALWTVTYPFTLLLVVKMRTVGATPLTYAANGNPVGIFCDGFDFKIYAGSGFVVGGAANTAWHIQVATFNGASSKHRIDGGAGATGDTGSLAPGGIALGGDGSGFSPIDVAECLVYDTALGLSDLDDLGDYLATKYSLTWTPAA